MKKKLWIPLILPLAFLVFGPIIVPFFAPWSAINCKHEEINIKTGQSRYKRYIWFIKVSERVEDTLISTILDGETVDIADIEPWHKVNTFSFVFGHSPHYIFHGALAQVRELEIIFELKQPTAEQKREIVETILEFWQSSGHDGGVRDYLGELMSGE